MGLNCQFLPTSVVLSNQGLTCLTIRLLTFKIAEERRGGNFYRAMVGITLKCWVDPIIARRLNVQVCVDTLSLQTFVFSHCKLFDGSVNYFTRHTDVFLYRQRNKIRKQNVRSSLRTTRGRELLEHGVAPADKRLSQALQCYHSLPTSTFWSGRSKRLRPLHSTVNIRLQQTCLMLN